MKPTVTPSLVQYIESSILPLYDDFDAGHQRPHVLRVIAESLRLADIYHEDMDIVYCAAAYHDVGLSAGRDTHHLVSGQRVRDDQRLRQWFDDDAIDIIAQACEDHRASSKSAPRSIVGRIVAESDRDIEPYTIVRRTVQYGIAHYGNLDRDAQWQRLLDHLHEKYYYGGYLQLWIAESHNSEGLQALRDLIDDKQRLRKLFDVFYNAELQSNKTKTP